MLDREHLQAQEIAVQAEACLRSGRRDKALRLYSKAATLERKALRAVPNSKVKTRGVLGVSLAALLYKAEKYEDAEDVSSDLLTEAHLTKAHRQQLQEVIQEFQIKAQEERRHGRQESNF